jgi:tetraacyldisaccharide 4'-kinase
MKVHRLDVPVVSVGNLTVGGTGKTPLAMHVIQHFLDQGRKVGLLSRGYGAAETGEMNDELKMIHETFPEVIICPGPDRVAKGKEAVKQGAEVIVLDDGFQHRRIHRDVNILALDARTLELPRFQLPVGPFRESWSGAHRADIVVITKCAPDADPAEVEAKVDTAAPVFCTTHAPVALLSGDRKLPLEHIKGRKVFVTCGIADPEHFVATVAALDCDVTGRMLFPDHHAYVSADLERIREAAADAEFVLTTEKDMVKLRSLPEKGENGVDFLALSITIAFLDDATEFGESIDALVQR